MQCYSELLPPTAVTHAVALNLIASERNLVVAKTSLLQIFNLRRTENGKNSESADLALVGEYQLSGTVTSLERIRTQDSKNGLDNLLIACRDAKISLVKWDHDNHRIATVSIHYYEGDPIPRQPCDAGTSFASSILTVDPASRCVALKFNQRQLAILPFRQHGEDLHELDEDMEDARPVDGERKDGEQSETPYKKSFVLSLPSLDGQLTDVIDLAFLHNYRESTFGILSSRGQATASLYAEAKHSVTYQVLTLDLEQGASTILATVPDLPLALWKVVPLPSPMGGTLLLGTNEVIHIAQSGKTHAVTVNEYAEVTGAFPVTDQSSLSLKLEDCVVELLDAEAGDILFALRDGNLAVLHLTLLGPDVKGMDFTPLTSQGGGDILQGLPSCAALLDTTYVFLGSDEADALLLRCSYSTLARKRSHAEMSGQSSELQAHSQAANDDDDDDDDDMEEDDLYSNTVRKTRSTTSQAALSSHGRSYQFHIADKLPTLGPLNSICFGRRSDCGTDKAELLASTGRQRGSRLTVLSRHLRPRTIRSSAFENAKSVWSIRSLKSRGKKSAPTKGPDNLLFASDGSTTKAYKTVPKTEPVELEELTGTEFEHDGQTIDIGTLGHGRWVVHCRKSEIRAYEPDLSLSQIIPMVDEVTDTELNIVYTSFCDPYLLVIRSDSSLQVLKHDSVSHDIEPIEMNTAIAAQKWLTGSLYASNILDACVAAVMLSDDGNLHILSLPELEPTYTAQNASHLPAILAADAATRRVGHKDTLTEVVMANIGHKDRSKPYLVFRTASDDLVFYEPFYATNTPRTSWTDDLKFRKVPVPYLPKYDEYLDEGETGTAAPLRVLKLGNYNSISIPGKPPCLVLCEQQSRPKVLRLHVEDGVSIVATSQHDNLGQNADLTFAVLTRQGDLHHCQISPSTWAGSGWAVEHLSMGLTEHDEIRHVAFHEKSGMYVVSTCTLVDFFFAADDTRHQEQDDITMRPQVPQYSLYLYSAESRRIISKHVFQPGELVTCVEVISMDTSEHTHKVQPLICVGLALLRGEDMPARGSLVVFHVLPVVSEPDDPETGIKLHVLSREDVKGAVTTIAPFVGGLVGISQGQKILVRGLKEDGSCLPVAFLDCQCQLTTLKTLWKSGLWLAGDSWKGLWLGGFTEDPYKLSFLGKGRPHMEVIAAEFLPFEDQLFIVAIDADMDLHVLQYDPEDPKTVTGTRLLHRGTFNIGHWPTSMTLVPSTLAPLDNQALSNGHSESDPPPQPMFHVLVTTQSGSITLVTPLDSSAYRRLGNVQAQMVSILEHPAALNPRQYRAAESDSSGSRGVIDGMLIQRIGELGSAKRSEVLARCGSDPWTMRSDLEVITGSGLSWL